MPRQAKKKVEKPKKKSKEAKEDMKKSSSKKKTSATAAETSADGKATTTANVVVSSAVKSSSSQPTREVDSSLFRGLDPERIATEISEKYKNMVVKGTSVELNQPELEIFVEKTTTLVEVPVKAIIAAEQEKQKQQQDEEQKKSETTEKPTEMPFPSIIDIQITREVFYSVFYYFLDSSEAKFN